MNEPTTHPNGNVVWLTCHGCFLDFIPDDSPNGMNCPFCSAHEEEEEEDE